MVSRSRPALGSTRREAPLEDPRVNRDPVVELHRRGAQAQFSSDFARLEAKVDQVTDAVLGLTGVVGRLTGAVGQLAERQADTERLAAEQRREVDRRFVEPARALNALAEAQRRTETNLNSLILTFERHLRENRGHGPS